MADHPLAHRARSVLVVVEPALQFPGGQRCHRQCRQQRVGMRGVGARQRHHHPGGRPRRQLARTYRRQRRFRKAHQQLQPPADPTHVAPTPAGQLVLRQALALHQLAQQQRFLDAGERTVLRARQHPQHRFGQPAVPLLDAGGVAAEPAQRGDAAIAVDQHQVFCVRAARLAGGHHDAGHDLAATFDGVGDPIHRRRFHQTAGGEAQVEAMQVKLQAMAVHGATASRAAQAAPMTSSFARSRRRPRPGHTALKSLSVRPCTRPSLQDRSPSMPPGGKSLKQ